MARSRRFRNYARLRAAIAKRIPCRASKHRYRLVGSCWNLDVWPTPRQRSPYLFTIDTIYVNVPHRGRGVATEVLRGVIAAADALGYALRLRVKPFGAAAGPAREALIGWYTRLGFKESRQSGVWRRAPRVTHRAHASAE